MYATTYGAAIKAISNAVKTAVLIFSHMVNPLKIVNIDKNNYTRII